MPGCTKPFAIVTTPAPAPALPPLVTAGPPESPAPADANAPPTPALTLLAPPASATTMDPPAPASAPMLVPALGPEQATRPMSAIATSGAVTAT
jgi:hypothetical protein